jgi:1,2-dihydroxy-3-keto-5-methylthiopentene dioxygenase
MVKAYYHDNLGGDPQLPHEGDPVPPEVLGELGIYAAKIDDRAEVDRIARERGYVNRDEVCILFFPFSVKLIPNFLVDSVA